MALCGPCVVLPSNPRSGLCERRDTSRIPLPGCNIESRTGMSRKTSPTKQEVVIKAPSLSHMGKYSTSDNRASLNVDSVSNYSFKERPTTHLPQHKPHKMESLVLANQRGRYVGTRHLKPLNSTHSTISQPFIHTSKRDGETSGRNPPLSTQIPRKKFNNERQRSKQPFAAWTSDSPTLAAVSEGDKHPRENPGAATSANRRTTENSITLKRRNQESVPSGIPTHSLSSSTSSQPKASIRRLNVTNTNNHNRPPNHSLGETLSSNISLSDRRETSKLPRRFQPSITTSGEALNLKPVSFSGSICDVRSLRGKENNPGLKLTQRNSHPNEKLKNLAPINTLRSHSFRPNHLNGVKATSGKPPLFASQESSTETNKTSVKTVTLEDELDLSATSDILDFSIESGEESPCDESMLDAENFEDNLEDDVFDLDEGRRGSDEDTTNQDAVTVINTGRMVRSDDTIIDTSMSSEENILELLIENEEELDEREETDQISNPDESPDSSTDQFLVQSFRQLQQEVGEQDPAGMNEPIIFPDPSYPITNQSLHNFERRGSEPFPSMLSPLSEDESDYIDIDCDVQPMPALNRPLVYGYGLRLPMRTRNINQPYRHSFHSNKLYLNNESHIKDHDSMAFGTTPLFPTMQETAWDYYRAKSASEGIDRIEAPLNSRNIPNKHCHVANDCYYDPEILLAQLSHPKSLTNATFSEYATHIKSSIMDRYALHHGDDIVKPPEQMEYGSCVDLVVTESQPVAAIDPGYYSESDVTKFKKGDYESVETLKSEHEDGCDDYYSSHSALSKLYPQRKPSYPNSKKSTYYSPKQNGLENIYNGRNDSQCYEKTYPPYKNLENITSKRLGVNPWLHLLPDITPPRTPLGDLISSTKKNKRGVSNSPSVTSLPLWPSKECIESTNQTSQSNQDENKEESVNIGCQGESRSVSSQKKSRRKSFLPTFFRKKSSSSKSSNKISNSSLTQNLKDVRKPPMTPDTQIVSSDTKNELIFPSSVSHYEHLKFCPSATSKCKQILPKYFTDSVVSSEKSNSSSSSSSKSSHSATSQDSVLTVISVKCS